MAWARGTAEERREEGEGEGRGGHEVQYAIGHRAMVVELEKYAGKHPT